MGRQPLLSTCQGGLGSPACPAVATGPQLLWEASATEGPCPLGLFFCGRHTHRAAAAYAAPHPPAGGEKGPLCSLHLFSAVAAAKAVGASRDARRPRASAPLLWDTQPALYLRAYAAHQGWPQRTAAGPPGVTRSSKAWRRRGILRRRRRKAVWVAARHGGWVGVGRDQTRHPSVRRAHPEPRFLGRGGGGLDCPTPPRSRSRGGGDLLACGFVRGDVVRRDTPRAAAREIVPCPTAGVAAEVLSR